MADLGQRNSESTLALDFMSALPEPLWQAMQSCSFWPRSKRAGPAPLCGAWQEMQASVATVV